MGARLISDFRRSVTPHDKRVTSPLLLMAPGGPVLAAGAPVAEAVPTAVSSVVSLGLQASAVTLLRTGFHFVLTGLWLQISFPASALCI